MASTIDEKTFKRYKKRVENDLKNYPFWLIAIETPNLGYPTRWRNDANGSGNESSFVEESAIDDMKKQFKVNAITKVLTNLENKSKKIIEEWYFRDTYNGNREELEKALELDKNKFYYLRNRALKKFMIALNYI